MDYPHKKIEEICSTTYGIILFDEQVIQITKDVAQLSMPHVVKMKKAVKYYSAEWMADLKDPFIEGMINNAGLSEADAAEWFIKIEKFCGYSYNKAHASAYTIISYWTAWLKANYSIEFMTALLSTSGNMGWYIHDSKRMGIEILPPDVNESDVNFKIQDDAIRIGLTSIKHLGGKAADQVVANQKFSDYKEFLQWWEEGTDDKKKPDHRSMDTRAVENLRRVGALDSIGAEFKGERGLAEMELMGFYLTHNPMEGYQPIIDEKVLTEKNDNRLNGGSEDGWAYVGGTLDRIYEHTVKSNGKKMAFLSVRYDDARAWDVVLFANTWAQVKDHLHQGDPVLIKGQWQSEKESLLGYKVMPKEKMDEKIDSQEN